MRHRFRTSAIVGPWRQSAAEASRDAVKARQARWAENGESLSWIVPGCIEHSASESRERHAA